MLRDLLGKAGRAAKSDTIKKVYKLYWSTYTRTYTHAHRHTPVDREEHLATGSIETEREWQLVAWLLPQLPCTGKAFDGDPTSMMGDSEWRVQENLVGER